MNIFITPGLLLSTLFLQIQGTANGNVKEAEKEIFKSLDENLSQFSKAYKDFKEYLHNERCLQRVTAKVTVLLEVLTVNRVTLNFASILQIVKDDLKAVGDLLTMTKDLVLGLTKPILEVRLNLYKELGEPKYLKPENFKELVELVNNSYVKIMELQKKPFEDYTVKLMEVIKKYELSDEKAKKLMENLETLKEGLFMTYEGVKNMEIKLYREIVFIPKKNKK